MKVSFVSKGDFKNALDWLDDAPKARPLEVMNAIGKHGVDSLASHTPRDTGETASSWEYTITNGPKTSEIAWLNSAHPESSANVAKLIELGHGTQNGGLVQPKPYIKKAMDDVFKQAGDKIAKGMIK